MAKPISREYRIYLALWRKAYRSEEIVTFKASNYAMAIAIRQGMYRAIKPFRNSDFDDKELKDAAEKFVIYLVKNDDPKAPHFIELRPRITLKEMELKLADLEISEDDLLIGEERELSDKLKKLINTGPKKTEEPATPFYTRD